jgi:hypothetical protein
VQVRGSLAAAGSISWAHQLFSRVKATMTKLIEVEGDNSWRQLEVGQQVGCRRRRRAEAALLVHRN